MQDYANAVTVTRFFKIKPSILWRAETMCTNR